MDYLFSFDLDIAGKRPLPPTEEPDAIISTTTCPDRGPNDTSTPTVYHALGESHVFGEPALRGHVVLNQERIAFVRNEDFADITGRLVLRTLDNALIEASYNGVLRARQRWPLLWRQGGPGREHAATIETRAHIAAQFETGAARYAWLPQHQCVGYGKLTLMGGEAKRASFDVYALGA
jgi:hypothetical protein